jgi:hypothetical protein
MTPNLAASLAEIVAERDAAGARVTPLGDGLGGGSRYNAISLDAAA